MIHVCDECKYLDIDIKAEPCLSCESIGIQTGKETDNFEKHTFSRFEKIKAMAVEEMAKKIVTLNLTDKFCKGKFSEAYSGNCPCDGRDELSCCIDWLNEIETEVQANE